MCIVRVHACMCLRAVRSASACACMHVRVCLHVCVRMHACSCACACVRAWSGPRVSGCMRVCARALVCVVCTCITVFGKHCECNAQKCTHLKRLPPLSSHLLLLSHCVLTKHEGQKNHMTTAGNRTMNTPEREHASDNYDKVTRMNSKPDESSSQTRCRLIKVQITTAPPYESCEILKGRPRRNVFSKLVYYQYKSFPADRSVRRKSKNQLGWVINPVPHNLVRRIRFWRIKISSTWFYIFVLDKK